ncbi:hypothetical protein [Longimicrobium terrae]|uniref:Uncharacterized protein n=1 Tax=Longimicrobium terrae TaxID=1639882 RepID=A0A841H0M4_9BACT|nr:hypothetical protein [Longimicrobium terrae]MBB4637182.1 hypothetical protein [Longimicrobium terrae]MBB6071557.1 hypothetical protein [Longimicrobium terrae]NNC30024.1 hypothetical protein [Longimicrobium terrae]
MAARFARIFLLLPALLCTGCGDDRPRDLEGRWEVRMQLTENWYKRRQPLTGTIMGEIVFSRDLPRLFEWNLPRGEMPPYESGCAFLPEELFAGEPANPLRSSPNAARDCDVSIGYRTADMVQVGLHVGYVDAETWFTGFRHGDTITGTWIGGSESLDQGGRGTFVMRRTGAASARFYELQRDARSRHRVLTIIDWIDWFFSLRREARRPLVAVLAAGAVLTFAAAWLAGNGARRRSAASLVMGAACTAEWLCYEQGPSALRLATADFAGRTIHWLPVLALLGTMILILVLTGLALRSIRRSALLNP